MLWYSMQEMGKRAKHHLRLSKEYGMITDEKERGYGVYYSGFGVEPALAWISIGQKEVDVYKRQPLCTVPIQWRSKLLQRQTPM